MNHISFVILSLLVYFGCSVPVNPIIIEIPGPDGEAGEPNLFTSSSGKVFLSWLEHTNDTTFSLNYSILQESKWSDKNTIASSTDWFVNWADFPSMAVYSGDENALVAHWLQMSAEGTYDYDVKIAQSTDGGITWDAPFTPHKDGIPAEHGFVSLLPLSDNAMFATWLDGRNSKSGDSDPDTDHSHGSGAMTLRSAIFDKEGNMSDEVELDDRVCDCCQTSAAKTSSGIIVAYRDRSENEIRDISVVRKEGDTWYEPIKVYSDNWFIPGCPVNGPVIRTNQNLVAIAWFAMNDTIPEVKVAFSQDGGKNFDLPYHIDSGSPLGRVGLEFISTEEVLASWLEKDGEDANILGMRLTKKGPVHKEFTIARTSPSRRGGFPVIAKYGEGIIAAWTEVDSITSVKTALLSL